jgi:arsenite methyltransferase
VLHATKRAEALGVNIKYVNADMEAIPLPDDMIDVVISNGAFCLAPNKEKAFREIYRVLRPGGRMSVCTSTVKLDL